jgi:ligand-binding SRPBCC domain-containing protein
MTFIKLETNISAPIERVFDLARSIDLHKTSTLGTDEKAIAGRTTGLIELGETVTWRAKHFGLYQELTVKVTELRKPFLFADIMVKGTFKNMKHTHRFSKTDKGTLMIDEFEFVSPLGILGQLADKLFLKQYMTNFLKKKNQELIKVAEGIDYKTVLKNKG